MRSSGLDTSPLQPPPGTGALSFAHAALTLSLCRALIGHNPSLPRLSQRASGRALRTTGNPLQTL